MYGTSSYTPDLVVRGGVVYRVVADHLGSIRMIVDATSGAVVQRMDYDAWGALTVDTAPAWQSLGYVSGIQDRETGLVRFGARDYDAGVGRWTAKEPRIVARATGAYTYSASDPVNFEDPDGRIIVQVAIAATGATIGALSGWSAAYQAGLGPADQARSAVVGATVGLVASFVPGATNPLVGAAVGASTSIAASVGAAWATGRRVTGAEVGRSGVAGALGGALGALAAGVRIPGGGGVFTEELGEPLVNTSTGGAVGGVAGGVWEALCSGRALRNAGVPSGVSQWQRP